MVERGTLGVKIAKALGLAAVAFIGFWIVLVGLLETTTPDYDEERVSGWVAALMIVIGLALCSGAVYGFRRVVSRRSPVVEGPPRPSKSSLCGRQKTSDRRRPVS